jgi:hypothetical protein
MGRKRKTKKDSVKNMQWGDLSLCGHVGATARRNQPIPRKTPQVPDFLFHKRSDQDAFFAHDRRVTQQTFGCGPLRAPIVYRGCGRFHGLPSMTCYSHLLNTALVSRPQYQRYVPLTGDVSPCAQSWPRRQGANVHCRDVALAMAASDNLQGLLRLVSLGCITDRQVVCHRDHDESPESARWYFGVDCACDAVTRTAANHDALSVLQWTITADG